MNQYPSTKDLLAYTAVGLGRLSNGRGLMSLLYSPTNRESAHATVLAWIGSQGCLSAYRSFLSRPSLLIGFVHKGNIAISS